MQLNNFLSLRIACDGESSSGKSTAAKLISKKYNLFCMNSGLLFRYASKLIIKHKPKKIIPFLGKKFKNLNYKNITRLNLHSQKISNHVVTLAKQKKVRQIIRIFQKKIIKQRNRICCEGRDRVYEAYIKKFKNNVDLIINLQGDMPNIKPKFISKLVKLMRSNNCDIGTLASYITDKKDIINSNIVKVHMDQTLKDDNFSEVKDFFRTKKDLNNEKIYYHIGIYAFTNIALTKYVKLARSKLEIERNLEQMRAVENNLVVKVGLCNPQPIGVDTEEDLVKVSKEMN